MLEWPPLLLVLAVASAVFAHYRSSRGWSVQRWHRAFWGALGLSLLLLWLGLRVGIVRNPESDFDPWADFRACEHFMGTGYCDHLIPEPGLYLDESGPQGHRLTLTSNSKETR
ncbi:MAG TPA: hypothetical protein DCY40_06995 [Actinobacteria bacterium]|nr:hypothetical protein [Actinomycetota bacterium]